MTPKWRIPDIIDLEYFLQMDADGGRTQKRSETASAERRFYLEHARNHPGPVDRRALFRSWVDIRRQRETAGGMLPGALYTETTRLARLVLGLLAAVLGAALTWSLMSYSGSTPVNVFTCLWVLLAPQLLLLAALAVSASWQWVSPARSLKVIYPMIAALLRRLSRRILNFAAAKLPADKRSQIQSAIGLIGQSRTLYGGTFFWPVFITAQIIGICVNIGILGAMLVRVAITDLAFGWQSTLQLDPENVYRIVRAIAAPWAWLTDPPIAHPTLDQIAGSKMVLKEGLYHLATEDLVAWWPFLCLAVVCYGLAPRLVLMAWGIWRQKRRLAALTFTHAGCERLWQKMSVPEVATVSRPYGQKAPADIPAPSAGRGQARPPEPEEEELEPAVVLLPEEIAANADELAQWVRYGLGYQPARVIAIKGDPGPDARELSAALAAAGEMPARVVIIQEAWQPPIKEVLSWIRHMKQTAGTDAATVIALIGKPASNNTPAPASDTDRMIWRRAVDSLGDPYIRVESLGG